MDMILEYVSKFVSSFVLSSAIVYIWSKLLNKDIKLKSVKLYIILILLSIVSILNYYLINQYVRIISMTILYIISFSIVFKEKLNTSILAPIYTQLIFMISEMFFVVLVCILFDMNNEGIINTQFGQFLSNISITSISLIIIKIPWTSKFYCFLVKVTDKINKNQLAILSILIMMIANTLTMILYYKVEFRYLLIFNTCLTLFCLSIVISSLKTKNNYIKVYDKYNTTLNSLKEYEDILDRYRISNHENKNQLLTIRNMLPKTNKKLISYIDKIIENKLKDDDKAMLEACKIPAGGLRGLIYSKILVMKNLKINYILEISKEVKTVDLINLDDSLMLDICKVIGVYIDNAIEEVKKLKGKYINIEIYLEDNDLIISVSNNYEGVIDLDKLEEKGYTSKGKGHGYGLTLTKEIIDNNKKLCNRKVITKDSFSQILQIKILI